MSEQSRQVDLSVCQVGDVFHFRSGRKDRLLYNDCPGEFPYLVEGYDSFREDGSWDKDKGVHSENDIVSVTRNGEQITPAAGSMMKDKADEPVHRPNVGCTCDHGRYGTGEVPMIGDVVRVHNQLIGSGYGHEAVADGDTVSAIFDEYVNLKGGSTGWYAARFDLVSRAAPSAAPASEPAAGPVITIGSRKIQRCSVCGEKLEDNLKMLQGRVAAVGGPPEFLSWPVGELVQFDGNRQSVLAHGDGDQLPSDACIELVEED